MGIIYRSWSRFVLRPPPCFPAPRDLGVSILSSFDHGFEPISPWPDHGPMFGSLPAIHVGHGVVTVHSMSEEAPSALTTRAMSSLS